MFDEKNKNKEIVFISKIFLLQFSNKFLKNTYEILYFSTLLFNIYFILNKNTRHD